MMSILDMVTGELPPTATYKKRSFVWIPYEPWEMPDGRIGTLTITLKKSRRAGTDELKDHYGVEELNDPSFPLPEGVRMFVLGKETGKETQVYGVTIAPVSRCTCTAGCVKAVPECKHVSSILALIEGGVL